MTKDSELISELKIAAKKISRNGSNFPTARLMDRAATRLYQLTTEIASLNQRILEAESVQEKPNHIGHLTARRAAATNYPVIGPDNRLHFLYKKNSGGLIYAHSVMSSPDESDPAWMPDTYQLAATADAASSLVIPLRHAIELKAFCENISGNNNGL